MNLVKPLLSFVVIFFLSYSLSCKKDTLSSNINLIDKSPSVIERYIAGKWEMKYYKIGFSQTIVDVLDSTFWNFDFTKDSVYFINKTTISDRHSIKWGKTANYITGNGFITIMDFSNGYPGYGVEGIHNDTLVLFEPGPDGNGYFFTRQ